MSHFRGFYPSLVSFLAKAGLARLSRELRDGQPCLLTFHGLRADDDPGLLDPDLHTPVSVFRNLCRHLAAHYRVLPLGKIVSAFDDGLPLPDGAAAITFDDGYASNHDLAWPVLREFGLPATVFLTTGFVDREEQLWFHRLETALASAGSDAVEIEIGGKLLILPLKSLDHRRAAFAMLAREIKLLPQESMSTAVSRIERQLRPQAGRDLRLDTLRPLTWEQARQMHRSGLIEFGAHTRRHFILSRCPPAAAEREIRHSRDRIAAELGSLPELFAYPNGQPEDHTPATARMLREAGFAAAVTMSPGFITPGCDRFALPRYGAPASVAEAEATVSGAFESLKQFRLAIREALVPSP